MLTQSVLNRHFKKIKKILANPILITHLYSFGRKFKIIL